MKDRYYLITERVYRKGCFVGIYEYEVEREFFIEKLEHLNKEEYECLMKGQRLFRGCCIFEIKDRFQMLTSIAHDELCKIFDTQRLGIYKYDKICKIVNGIKDGKINKDNLYKEVDVMTKNVKSKQSISDWKVITDWFANAEW